MISEGGSHLKQGSRLAIFMVIIDDKVPSNARLFLLLVLFSPTTENTLSASAFAWGNTRTSLATGSKHLEFFGSCHLWKMHQEHNGKTYLDF